jgi:hypothetical protein
MISGLVVHLDLDEGLAAEAVTEICAERAIEAGVRQAKRLPIVLECATPRESHDMTDWLIGLSGVTHVDVAFVDLESTRQSCQVS